MKGIYTFPKSEHLKSKSITDSLYADGMSVTSFPMRAVFMPIPKKDKQPVATILISVSKRRFRHAVDRNLVKRRMREAYRLSKPRFLEELENRRTNLAIAIIYIDTKHCGTEYLTRRMQKLLNAILGKEQKKCVAQ